MNKIILSALAGASILAASGPAAFAAPVRVTRFHLGTPITPGPISIQSPTGTDPQSLETRTYADAVSAEMGRLGFAPVSSDPSAPLIADVSFTRKIRDETSGQPPVTIGLGGGSFGGGVGGGVGASFGIGKPRVRSYYQTELAVQLRRRSDGAVIWEGRAQMEANATSKEAQASIASGKLAQALLKGFPGESGRTITVK